MQRVVVSISIPSYNICFSCCALKYAGMCCINAHTHTQTHCNINQQQRIDPNEQRKSLVRCAAVRGGSLFTRAKHAFADMLCVCGFIHRFCAQSKIHIYAHRRIASRALRRSCAEQNRSIVVVAVVSLPKCRLCDGGCTQ